MAYHSLEIYENLITSGMDPHQALIEAKFKALDYSQSETKKDINFIKKKLNNMKYWFIFIIVSIYLPLGKGILMQILNYHYK